MYSRFYNQLLQLSPNIPTINEIEATPLDPTIDLDEFYSTNEVSNRTDSWADIQETSTVLSENEITSQIQPDVRNVTSRRDTDQLRLVNNIAQ